VITLASYIDHTILKPVTTHIEIEKICREAGEYGFAAVCVPPPLVPDAVGMLARAGAGPARDAGIGRNGVKVATVIGFPFGYSTVKAKLAEVGQAIADGADELDIVINLIALKGGRWLLLEEEMRVLTERAHADQKLVKVIIESGVLLEEEIIRCCEIYSRVGVDFLKTSTGYAAVGATVGAVQLMRQHLPADIRIKASGGIRDAAFARELIAAGADRLGCSASVDIVREDAASGAVRGRSEGMGSGPARGGGKSEY
jgi:deoxyribose-phosphate aldolase